MHKKICVVLALALLLSGCNLAAPPVTSETPEPTASTVAATPVSLLLAETPTPAMAAETPTPAALVSFDPLRIPAFAEEFLGESLADYRTFILAILAGEPVAQLSETGNFQKIERAYNAMFPQKTLLYDSGYRQGIGPFTYDAATRTVAINYLYDAATHQTLLEAYADRMNEALALCTPGMTQREQAEALFLRVVENLHYVLDMRLGVYEAVTTGEAFCQTYSALYQLLLAQVGIECFEVGGSVDTDGDGESNDMHQWNRLYLDGEWIYADPTWDSGDLRYFGLSYEECLESGYLAPFLDPADALLD